MDRTQRAVLAALAVLVLAASLAVLIHAAPVSGKMDAATLDYLQHGPRPPDQPRYFPSHDAYPTLRLQEAKSYKDLPNSEGVSEQVNAQIRPADFLRGLEWVGGTILDGMKALVLLPFSLLTANAAAACGIGLGSCFWIGGTGNFSSTAHWSASTGGASCACTPAASDTVTFDASSGAGTATQDIAGFTSGAVTMTNSSVTVSGSSNLWRVGGSWTDGGGKFSSSTSTIEFTANANATVASNYIFKNLTVDNATTLTLSSGNTVTQLTGTLTVSGTATVTGTAQIIVIAAANSPSISSTSTMSSISLAANIGGGTNININPGTTLAAFCVGFSTSVTLTGNLTTTGTFPATGSLSCDSGYGLDVSNNSNSALIAGTAIVSITGGVSVGQAGSYITSAAGGSWTVDGAWNNPSTSASWSFAAPITFKSATNQTMTFSNLNPEFTTGTTVTFDTTALSGVTYTLAGGPLRITGGIQIGNSTAAPSGFTIMDASVNNVGLVLTDAIAPGSNGCLCFLSWGAFKAGSVGPNVAAVNPTSQSYMWLGSGTWTVTREWLAEAINQGALWNRGTGTVILSGGASQGCNGFNAFGGTLLGTTEFNNVIFDSTIAAGITWCFSTTLTYLGQFNGPLTAAGSVTVRNTAAGASGPTIVDANTVKNFGITAGSLTVGAYGAIVSRDSTYTVSGAVNISSATGYIASTSGGTWTVGGAWSNSSTSASWSFSAPITFSGSGKSMAADSSLAPEFGGGVTIATGASYTLSGNLTTPSLDCSVGTLNVPSDVTGQPAVAVTGISLSITSGYMTISNWDMANPASSGTPNYNFQIGDSDPNTLTATLQMAGVSSVGGWLAGTWVGNANANNGTATLTFKGTLNAKQIRIYLPFNPSNPNPTPGKCDAAWRWSLFGGLVHCTLIPSSLPPNEIQWWVGGQLAGTGSDVTFRVNDLGVVQGVVITVTLVLLSYGTSQPNISQTFQVAETPNYNLATYLGTSAFILTALAIHGSIFPKSSQAPILRKGRWMVVRQGRLSNGRIVVTLAPLTAPRPPKPPSHG